MGNQKEAGVETFKIGTLTFQGVNNYGAVLQAYALQTVLRTAGYDSEIVNYHRDNVADLLCWFKNKTRGLLRGKPDRQLYTVLELCNMVFWGEGNTKDIAEPFRKFREKMVLSEPVGPKTVRKLNGRYDLFLSGSDQVWNCGRVNLEPTYLLDFVDDPDKKGSYAASFGLREIPEKYRETYQRLLQDYRFLSVREEQGAQIIRDLVQKQAEVVLDPTMLLSASQWLSMSKKPLDGQYILVYQLEYSDSLMRFARLLSEKEKLPLRFIKKPKKGAKAGEVCPHTSPEEWVGLFAGAEYVLTNSFHGTVFSILFHKPFFTEIAKERIRGAMASRLENLLSFCGLTDRLLDETSIEKSRAAIDYTTVEEILQRKREASLHYLFQMVEQRKREKAVQVFERKEDCCGCTACKEACPVGAISMKEDAEGFSYPWVDPDKCVSCGLCRRICPMKQEKEIKPVQAIYGMKADDLSVRQSSTSGGAFTAISDAILRQGGVVFGAAFDEQFGVVHRLATTAQERDEMRGSKYTQSAMNRIYPQVKQQLEEGKPVLFTGTPCQNAGLKRFLGREYDRLYLCDIACHGVPSPKIWREYLEMIRREKGRVESVNFRDKTYGWHRASLRIDCEKGRHLRDMKKDPFYILFFDHYDLRPSCHQCPYASKERGTDLTLADFWGIEEAMPQMDDDTGVSLILCGTPKGQALLAQAQGLQLAASGWDACYQPIFEKPSPAAPGRNAFWKYHQNHGAFAAISRFGKLTAVQKGVKYVMVPVAKKLGLYQLAVKTVTRMQSGKKETQK
ncbi:MAG: polysaccharide pyruvyl transferase family protein [Oscillospiraceae bacterium]|nr:polysaccharide pyruvyl transferase family protein [Oscillospiraceae bacterium]